MMARRQLRGVDLVEPLGVSQPQVAARVRGDLAWSLDELDTLSRLFDCDVIDLVPARASTRQYVHNLRSSWGLAA